MNYKREDDLHLTWRKKNRSDFEIMALILEAVKDNGTTRYSLIKHMHSNFVETKKYLETLVEIGFIETDMNDGRVLYRTSEKGLDFLRQYYILLSKILSTRAYRNTVLSKYVKVP